MQGVQEKRFRVEQFIALLLLLNPYRNNIQISNNVYYISLAVLFVLKYWKERARPKTLLIILAYFVSILQVFSSKVYILTAFLCFLNLFYPQRVYYIPPISDNIGYKRVTIPGYNSEACVFYPCRTGDSVLVNWVVKETYIKFFTSRNNSFGRFFRLFEFMFSYMNTYKIRVRNGELSQHKGVIIFSHGAGGFIHAYTHFLSQLARQYIVVSIQHNQIPLVLGEEGVQKEARSQELQIRSLSILETLDYFKKQSNIQGLLGNYQPSKFFLMGHSYGGATVLNTNYITDIENKVDGIVLIDSWYRPVRADRLRIPLKGNMISIFFQKHLLWQEEITQFAKQLYENNVGKYEEYVIKGGCHMDITDIVYVVGSTVPIQKSKDPQLTTNVTLEIINKFMENNQAPRKEEFKDKLIDWAY